MLKFDHAQVQHLDESHAQGAIKSAKLHLSDKYQGNQNVNRKTIDSIVEWLGELDFAEKEDLIIGGVYLVNIHLRSIIKDDPSHATVIEILSNVSSTPVERLRFLENQNIFRAIRGDSA